MLILLGALSFSPTTALSTRFLLWKPGFFTPKSWFLPWKPGCGDQLKLKLKRANGLPSPFLKIPRPLQYLPSVYFYGGTCAVTLPLTAPGARCDGTAALLERRCLMFLARLGRVFTVCLLAVVAV